ncbi:hypothetical protein J6590_073928 [Homalodisca vitripennis]|nr:hypothetical protein J6590_073928 [Homalodisca vitripennis]
MTYPKDMCPPRGHTLKGARSSQKVESHNDMECQESKQHQRWDDTLFSEDDEDADPTFAPIAVLEQHPEDDQSSEEEVDNAVQQPAPSLHPEPQPALSSHVPVEDNREAPEEHPVEEEEVRKIMKTTPSQ